MQVGKILGPFTVHQIEHRSAETVLGATGLALTVVGLTAALATGSALWFGVAALGLGLAAAITWLLFRSSAEAAGELAAALLRAERPALNQLLGDQAAPPVADTPFAQPPVELVSWRSDGGGDHGSLREIAEYYRGLTRGRLVVIGEPGAGKTVLLLQLVLSLLDGTPQKIPVRLSLPTFDPAPDLPAAEIAAQFDAWIVAQLRKSYGLSRWQARDLVRNGAVLPVLDGLDEMDPDDTEPVRAAAVVRALNLRPDQVVLACRSARYHQLSEPLQDVTVIEIRPLTPELIVEYLTARFPDVSTRWRPLMDRLCQPRPDDALVAALQSPLRLYLAATAYQSGDPAELLPLVTPEEIDRHLLDRFVPAATAADPRYRPEDVDRWLVNLALVLDGNARHGRSGSDLQLNDVWRVAGHWLPRLVGTVPTLLLATFGTNLAYRVSGDEIKTLLVGGLFYVFAILSVRFDQELSYLKVRATGGRHSRRQFVYSTLMTAACGGAMFALMLYSKHQLGNAIGAGTTMAVVASLYFMRGGPAATPRPSRLVRRGVHSELTVSIIAITMGVVLVVAFDNRHVEAFTAIGLLPLLASLMLTPWMRYCAAILLTASRGKLPWHPARFLDWALDAGLLRMSGSAVQFRHREFQRHLVR